MKIQKYGLLIAGLALLAFALIGCTTVRGNGEMTEETRDVGEFSRIEVSGAGDVIIEFGERESVRIEAESNLMEYLETNVIGQTLEIGSRNNTLITSARGYTFYVTVTELERVSVSGSASITLPEISTQDDFELDISGSGSVSIESLVAESLDVDISGSGEVDIQGGEVEEQDIQSSGSGDYQAEDLSSRNADVDVSGSGSLRLSVSGELKGDVSGSGSVLYSGNPEEVDVDTSGSGEVEAMN